MNSVNKTKSIEDSNKAEEDVEYDGLSEFYGKLIPVRVETRWRNCQGVGLQIWRSMVWAVALANRILMTPNRIASWWWCQGVML